MERRRQRQAVMGRTWRMTRDKVQKSTAKTKEAKNKREQE